MKYKIRIADQDFNVDVGDINARPIKVYVDGETFEVYPESLLPDQKPSKLNSQAPDHGPEPLAPIKKPTLPTYNEPDTQPSLDREKVIKAPIPGIINKISIQVGAEVEYGQELCVLEAMKMNNLIRAPKAGTIAVIYISEGKQVKHGDILMEFA
jgi:biotin carboxyl carrier protein